MLDAVGTAVNVTDEVPALPGLTFWWHRQCTHIYINKKIVECNKSAVEI